jgi:hypothetical protein
MREHFVPPGEYSPLSSDHYVPTDGLWQVDPGGGASRRIRPFLATNTHYNTDSYRLGDHGFLTVRGDRVLYQAYPYDLHFDALSWRMVNRLPAARGEITGWALQGPFLADAAVEGTGLEPGVHGIARCVMRLITMSHWGFTECAPVTVPGTSEPTRRTEERVLLAAPGSPGVVPEATAEHVFTGTSWDGDKVLLGFDPGRRGFWRGGELEARFHPVTDGGLLPATTELDLGTLPFGMTRDNSFLSALYYHPVRQRLFGVLSRKAYTSPPAEWLLFSVDPANGDAVRHGVDLGEHYPPFTLTSFGAEPEVHAQLIPIVADAVGRHLERWRTDLWLYNPSGAGTTVRVSRLRRPDVAEEIPLPPHGSRRLADVLLTLGGGPGGDGVTHDALRVSSGFRWGEQVVAFARIWTRDVATGGTFGHAVPAVPAPYGYSNHSVADPRTPDPTVPRFNIGANSLASHIDLDLREPGRYRHNLGIVNPGDEEVTIELAWTFRDRLPAFETFGPDVEGYRRASVSVPAGSLKVVGIEDLFPDEVVGGWPPRIGVFGSKPAILWYTLIDNLTGDATFVPYTLFSATTPPVSTDAPLLHAGYRLAIPVVAHTEGVGHTLWRTDLVGYSYSEFATPTPFVAYHPSDSADCRAPGEGLEISRFLEGELAMPVDSWLATLGFVLDQANYYGYIEALHTIFPDVVRRFSECAEATGTTGGLEILAGSWFSGFSRTYATRPDGGTYGGMLPLYPPGGWPVQHFGGLDVGPERRINLGFFNGNHDHAITSQVTLYDAEGRQVAERELTLEPLASTQHELKRFFRLATLSDGSYGLTVLPLDDPEHGVEGRSWAYVSVIDNGTNDPTNLW